MSGSRRRRGLAISLGILVGLPLLAEGGARLWLGDDFSPDVVTEIPLQGCVAFDPELGWSNPPSFQARAVLPSIDLPLFEYTVTINARGLRDREYALEAPPDTLRILALGDSFTWGWGVDDGECWADLLEERLGPDVEVINTGVPGFGTDQELLLFEREGVRYAPDLVLLCFLLNDVEGNRADFLNGFGKPLLAREADGTWGFRNLPVANTPLALQETGGSWSRRLKRRSALVRLLAPAPEKIARPNPFPFPEDSTPEEMRAQMRATPWPLPLAQNVPGLLAALADPESPTHELLRRLQVRCDGLGAPLVAFSIAPHDPYLFIPGLEEPSAVAEAEAEGRPYQTRLSLELESAGEMLHFTTLAVDQAMLEAVRAGENLNNGDGHLTARGNEVVAGALEAGLRERLAELRAR